MPYDLVSDGQLVPLGDRKYLLSPQDLAGLEILPELARIGVASLKIEGRLKSPEYVANITRIYRQALDRLATAPAEDSKVSSRKPATPSLKSAGAQYEMEMAFSRGLYTGWFGGINNQRLVHARFGKKRGVYLGEIAQVGREGVVLRLEGPLKPGDGVVFDAGRPEEKEEGGRVYEIRNPKSEIRKRGEASNLKLQTSNSKGEFVELRFGRGDINFARVHRGDKLWKTSDQELEKRLRQSFEGDTPKFQRPLTLELHGVEGKALTVIGRDELGHVAQVESKQPLVRAEKQPLTTDRLREQLGRLGGTSLKLADLRNLLEGELMLPVSELNHLRRELVAELERLRAEPPRWTLNEQPAVQENVARFVNSVTETAELIVLVRTMAQLDAALASEVQTLYCEFEDPKKYREAVQRVRASSSASNRTVWVAPPRIFKMGEEWTLKQVRSSEADGYLIRNYDHLKFFASERRTGDYSLNIANRLSAEYFKDRFNLERVTASYDLNFEQLEALLEAAPAEWFEVTIHQHMPMFHMEHCVFCAFLSTGTDYTNCGRPCDKHELKLRDRVGAEHPVKADAGCRNTVFNALAQTGAEYVPKMLALGVRHFRLEFVNETSEQVKRTIDRYRQLLRGETSGTEVWRELKLLSQLGVTRGQIARK
jgi:putative protease